MADENYIDFTKKRPDVNEIIESTKKRDAQQKVLKNVKEKIKYNDKTQFKNNVTNKARSLYSGLSNFTRRPASQSIKAQKTVARRGLQVASLFLPQNTFTIPQQLKGRNRGVKGGGGRGRPDGPTGKYYIPGVGPVGVYQYRRWISQQRQIQSAQGNLQMRNSAPQQRVEQNPYEQVSNELPSAPEESPTMPTQVPTQMQFTQPRAPSPIDLQRQASMMREMQRQEQFQDNILNAPNFIKGDMVRKVPVGIQIPNILNAPNFMMGEMRRPKDIDNPIGRVNEFGEILMFDPRSRLGPKPIDNPRGNTFVEINPISGEPVLRKRISEKWLTGEAI